MLTATGKRPPTPVQPGFWVATNNAEVVRATGLTITGAISYAGLTEDAVQATPWTLGAVRLGGAAYSPDLGRYIFSSRYGSGTGHILYTDDEGASWTYYGTDTGCQFSGGMVGWNPVYKAFFGASYRDNGVWRSENGLSWTRIAGLGSSTLSEDTTNTFAINQTTGLMMTGVSGGDIYSGGNGSWTKTADYGYDITAAHWSPYHGVFVCAYSRTTSGLYSNAYILTSSDAQSWTQRFASNQSSSQTHLRVTDFATSSAGRIVGVSHYSAGAGGNGSVFYSGSTSYTSGWEYTTALPTSLSYWNIAYSQQYGGFAILADDSEDARISFSTTGISSWSAASVIVDRGSPDVSPGSMLCVT